MEYVQSRQDNQITVTLNGRFTFSDHEAFRQIIGLFSEDGVKTVTINMSGVEFVDSAALGMLLIAREEAEKSNVSLCLSGAQGQVEKMFKVSKFNDIFTLV